MKKASTSPERQQIIFFHPDLGIGGAERLIVDAAVGLQDLGHRVTIFTSHCDPRHCFEETRNGTLDVRVRGNTLIPISLFSTHRFVLLCAILRQLHLLTQITLFTSELRTLGPTVFFVDQLSAGLVFLRLLCPSVPVLFYCHFPDKLLAKGRKSWLKALYRLPFDALERWSTGLADKVVVNSLFTKGIFHDAFPGLFDGARKNQNGELVGEVSVVYPCVGADTFTEESNKNSVTAEDGLEGLFDGKKIILSINRFEEKKDISLVIRAFARMDESLRNETRLVVAGGYDPRILENVNYHNHLLSLCANLNLTTYTASSVALITTDAFHKQKGHHSLDSLSVIPNNTSVLFLLSIPATLKSQLLKNASLLVYTPRGEHFGIVPLEAMAAGVPVLAANEGGPVESVVDNVTGWLRDPDDVEEWTRVMTKVIEATHANENDTTLEEMARAGKERVRKEFSRDKMANRLDEELRELRELDLNDRRLISSDSLVLVGILGFVVLAALPWFFMNFYM